MNKIKVGIVPHKSSIALVRLFMLIVLTASFKTFARCYYIRPAGNDLNTGLTINSAFKTIAKLNSINLLPGDSVLFQGGQTHVGSIKLIAADGNNFSNPVFISSYGLLPAVIDAGLSSAIDLYNTQGISIRKLILKGSGMNINTVDGIILYTNLTGSNKPKNIKLEDLEIYGFGKSGITFGAWNGNAGFRDLVINNVKVHNVLANGIISYGYTSPTHIGWSHTNVSISNCELYDIPGYADPNQHKGSGIILGQVDGGLIEHCVAHNNGTANIACGGPGGIWAYDSNSLTIQYCESYSNSAGTGCDGIGFDFDGGVTNSVIQYCYSHDNDGAGFLLGQYANARIWKNNVVRFNISVNDGRTNSGGITVFKGAGTTMHSVDIYHNTVYFSKPVSNVGAGAFTIIDWYTGIDSIRVFNNILQTSGSVPISWIPTGYNAFMAGNVYWSDSNDFMIWDGGSQYNSLSAWRTATGKENYNGNPTGLASDPLLVNTGSSPVMWPVTPNLLNAYKPTSVSPVINAAITLTAFGIVSPNTDFYTSTFPSGPKADIGAGEFFFPTVTPTVPVLPTLTGTTVAGTNSTSPIVSGVSEDMITDFNIYPNPLLPGNILHIEGISAGTQVEVFTINGVKILAFNQNRIERPEFLQPGIYIVKVQDENGTYLTKKLIVQ